MIENGLADSNAGKCVPNEEIKRKLGAWQK